LQFDLASRLNSVLKQTLRIIWSIAVSLLEFRQSLSLIRPRYLKKSFAPTGMATTRISVPVRTSTRSSLTVRHKFWFNIGAEEVIEFQYHPPSEEKGTEHEDDEQIVIGKCIVRLNQVHHSNMGVKPIIKVQLESGRKSPFSSTKVTLSWTNKHGPVKLVTLTFSKEDLKQIRETQLEPCYLSDFAPIYLSNEVNLKLTAFLNKEEENTSITKNSLASDLDVLLKDGHQSDMKVEAGGSLFPWHKIILSSRSDVLKAMFTHGDLKECIDGKLVLEDGAEIVKGFLEYIYT
jgi:hypothetical protein